MSSLPSISERDTPPAFDVSYDGDVPQRHISDFIVSRAGQNISICALDDNHPTTAADFVIRGLLSANGKTLRVESAPLVEWCIEYSPFNPHLWVRSQNVWYKLMKPAKDYAKTHDLARKRFEVCARIFILLTTLDRAECTFKGIAHLLSRSYRSMRAYSERDILSERQFILSQFQMLSDPIIVNSVFVRDLKAKKIPPGSRRTQQQLNSNNSSSASSPPLHDTDATNGTATPNFLSASPAVGGYNSRKRRENSSYNFKNRHENNTNNNHNSHNNFDSNSPQYHGDPRSPNRQQHDRNISNIDSNKNSNSNSQSGRNRDRSGRDRDSADHRDYTIRDRGQSDRDSDRDRNQDRHQRSKARSQSHSRSRSRSNSDSRSHSPNRNSSSSLVVNGHSAQSRIESTMGGNHDLYGSVSASGSRNGWEPSTLLDDEMTQRVMKKVEKALANVMKSRTAYPFKQPVDPMRDGCVDYLDRIAKPMDYGTIKKRLESKTYYKNVPDVVDDVRQVTRNCIQYNGDDHDYSKWAINLLQKFESIVRPAEESELKARSNSKSAGKKRRVTDSLGSKSGANSSGSGNKKPAKSSRKLSDRSKAAKNDNHGDGGSRAGSDDLNVVEIDAGPNNNTSIDADGGGVGTSEGDDDGGNGSPKLCFRSQTQACDKTHAPKSKYCSPECGMIVARERIAELTKSGYNPEEYIRAFITKTLVHSRF